MERMGKAFAYIVVVGMMVGIIYGFIELIRWLVHIVTSLRASELTIIIPAVVATMGFVGVLVQKYLEKRKDIELRLRDEKARLYDAVTTNIFELLTMVSRGENLESRHEQIAEKNNEISRLMLMWGSDKVLKKYTEYRLSFRKTQTSVSPFDAFKPLGELILEFRKDLGHKNKGLDHKDIIRTLFDDVEAMAEQSATPNKSDVPISISS